MSEALYSSDKTNEPWEFGNTVSIPVVELRWFLNMKSSRTVFNHIYTYIVSQFNVWTIIKKSISHYKIVCELLSTKDAYNAIGTRSLVNIALLSDALNKIIKSSYSRKAYCLAVTSNILPKPIFIQDHCLRPNRLLQKHLGYIVMLRARMFRSLIWIRD